ncbi:hypothetical protein [Hymenobacter properus]|uniref:Uncharacterized protein n=1 Tax=Hymenobacter properus TaxID=2791026 RepID=A0A931FKU4_9BACT|nr:hypothetical protein [Hymenobacter properus]MBF9144297.1 hypothetical protein [Hymenobacter properus]MBR7723115.1 hypothetical protein [Microvirga sp. SRT04]
MQPQSFWPSKSGTSHNGPLKLLEKQAELLSTYDSSLEGRVTTAYSDGDDKITVALYILNHKIRGYNYRLISFEQKVGEEYPVTLRVHYNTTSPEVGTASNAAEFEKLLAKTLADNSTKNILDYLLNMGNIMHDYREDLE